MNGVYIRSRIPRQRPGDREINIYYKHDYSGWTMSLVERNKDDDSEDDDSEDDDPYGDFGYGYGYVGLRCSLS